jgi:hypothetical protein
VLSGETPLPVVGKHGLRDRTPAVRAQTDLPVDGACQRRHLRLRALFAVQRTHALPGELIQRLQAMKLRSDNLWRGV